MAPAKKSGTRASARVRKPPPVADGFVYDVEQPALRSRAKGKRKRAKKRAWGCPCACGDPDCGRVSYKGNYREDCEYRKEHGLEVDASGKRAEYDSEYYARPEVIARRADPFGGHQAYVAAQGAERYLATLEARREHKRWKKSLPKKQRKVVEEAEAAIKAAKDAARLDEFASSASARRGAPPAPAPAAPRPERPASRARDFRTIRAQQKRIQQERAEAARKFAASQSDRAAAERAKVEQTQREIDEIRARTQRPSRDEWAAVADPGGVDAEAAPAARSPLRPRDAAAVAATRARADAAGAQLDEEARRLGAWVLDKPFDVDELVDIVTGIVPPARYDQGWR